NVPQNDEQYIYVYGYKDMKSGTKDLVVSRVPREEIRQFDKWEFWDGTKWSKDILDAAVLVEGVSPELSVDYIQSGPFKDQYVLVYEKDTLSGYIAVSTTDRPEGPFSKSKIIHFVPEAEKNEKSIITYNAKAHPYLSKEGELLISYNVNTTNPSGNIADADIYRPRWIRIREIKSE